jgi:hypothetical protein
VRNSLEGSKEESKNLSGEPNTACLSGCCAVVFFGREAQAQSTPGLYVAVDFCPLAV